MAVVIPISIVLTAILLLYKIFRALRNDNGNITMKQRVVAVNMLAYAIAIVAYSNMQTTMDSWWGNRTGLIVPLGVVVIFGTFIIAKFTILMGRNYRKELIDYEINCIKKALKGAGKFLFLAGIIFLGGAILVNIAWYLLIGLCTGMVFVLFLLAVLLN